MTDMHDRQRKTLWAVLLLNVAISLGFFATGAFGDSSALIANGLDNTSDSMVYAISRFAMSRSDKWKRIAANVSGTALLLFAVGIVADAIRRYYTGSEPLGPLMISMALIAAAVRPPNSAAISIFGIASPLRRLVSDIAWLAFAAKASDCSALEHPTLRQPICLVNSPARQRSVEKNSSPAFAKDDKDRSRNRATGAVITATVAPATPAAPIP